MKKTLPFLIVVALLANFGQTITAHAGAQKNKQAGKKGYWSNYNQTVSWDEFLHLMKTAPEFDKARLASIPNSAPTNKEQVQALQHLKKLLLADLKEYKKEINSRKGPQSNAVYQSYNVTEDKLNDVTRLLSIWNKQNQR